eukprot:3672277-Pleurochrysis_carterae.AAC.1
MLQVTRNVESQHKIGQVNVRAVPDGSKAIFYLDEGVDIKQIENVWPQRRRRCTCIIRRRRRRRPGAERRRPLAYVRKQRSSIRIIAMLHRALVLHIEQHR